MPRRFLLILFLCAALGTWWYFSRPGSLPRGTPILVERRTEGVEEVATVERTEREAPRELEIRGLLFAQEPERYRVRLGGEEIVPDAAGAFLFDAAVRGRWGVVELWRDDDLVATERVLTGDPAPADALEDPALARFPERPARIGWSWILLRRQDDGSALSIDSAFGEEWGRGGRVVVRGRTDLPDGASLDGNLQFGRLRFIASLDPATVAEGRYALEIFCPLETIFYAGEYRVQIVFSTLLQRAEFRLVHAEVQTLTENGEILVERGLCLGEPERARSEDLAVEVYYTRLLDEAERAEQVLRARVDEIQRLAKDWNPEVFAGAESARSGWFHEPMRDESGRFVVASWRRFLDDEWRPNVRALLDEHGHRGQEKYMEAADHMGRVLRSLHDLSFMYSKFRVYPLFALSPAPEDWYEDAYEGGDISLAERTLRASKEELERYRRLVSGPRASPANCEGG